MKTDTILLLLKEEKHDEFLLNIKDLYPRMTEKEKQNFLCDIIDNYYDNKYYSFFKKTFDILIGAKLNLNFNIEHWAPSFLSLIILKAPYKQLFEYFLKKGADLNFISDSLFFEEDKSLENKKELLLEERYATCLDFAQLKLADLLTIDYNYEDPERKFNTNWRELENPKEEIILSKREYLYLFEQAEYLNNLINTDRLTDHIKSIGGQTYEELKQAGLIYKFTLESKV